MKILNEKLSVAELKGMASSIFGDMVKGVVDVERGLLALDAQLHSDLEALLLKEGSAQANLWELIFIMKSKAMILLNLIP